MGESFFSAMNVLQTLSTLFVTLVGIGLLIVIIMYVVDITQTSHAVRD